jgi:Integrase core domain.
MQLRKEVQLGGDLIMSKGERDWLKVLERVKKKQITLKEASSIMGVSYRQGRRRNRRFKEEGDKGLTHRGRGRASNRSIEGETRKAIIERYQERYEDFGPTLAAEKLGKEGLEVDHETLRRWLIKERLWKKRRRRSAHRSWRERRAHFGELVQMDGSHHKWFEERRSGCCLMNMVDDATGQTMSLLDEQETTVGAMRLLWQWIDRYGIPKALYTDRKNVYVPDEKTARKAEREGVEVLTQFGRACKELGIRIIEAHSPQAKGRVERSNGTYQDRLVKELRLEGISDLGGANKLLSGGFVEELNEKFAVAARETSDFHKSAKGRDLKSIFCIEEDRVLSDDWIVRYGNGYYQMTKKSDRPPTNKKLKVRHYLNGELHFNYRGQDLQYVRLPERPTSEKKIKKLVSRGGKPVVPSSDHPWRSFVYGKRALQ